MKIENNKFISYPYLIIVIQDKIQYNFIRQYIYICHICTIKNLDIKQ